MDNCGQFKATFFWKEMLQYVFSHATFHSKKKKRKEQDNYLVGNEIIDLIHVFLQRKNGNYINSEDLSRTNAIKVLHKMIEMNVLSAASNQKCDEDKLYWLNETYRKLKTCSNPRTHCLNPCLPSCILGEISSLHNIIHKKIGGDQDSCVKLEKYSTDNMLFVESNCNAGNGRVPDDKPKKRRSLFGCDDSERTLPKVKCIRRHSYNLANRHSEVYSRGLLPLFMTSSASPNSISQSSALSNLLYEFNVSNLEDVLTAIDNMETNLSCDYAFENKTFAEPAVSTDDNDSFVDAALKCLSVVPSGYNTATKIIQKKIICFNAVKLYYRDKSIIPEQFNVIFELILNRLIDRSSATKTQRLTNVELCQLFVQILPINDRKELLNLIRVVKTGCCEKLSFVEKKPNCRTFYDLFSPALTKNASFEPPVLSNFFRFLVSNQVQISSNLSEKLLKGPQLMPYMEAEEMENCSTINTQREIRRLINNVQDSTLFSDSKKKMIVKKLKKTHLLP